MRHHVSLLLIVFSLVLQNVQSQLSLVKNEDCGENETFQTCGTACEPSCDTPSQSFCTLQCVVGCQCDKGFLRNSNKECVSADKCSTTNNTSTHAPASTTGATVALNCSRNEVASDCHNPCTEKKCPKENPVMVNCLMMCQHGCSCKDGFVRNDQGECVDESTCPPVITNSTENQCNLVDCRTGTQCEIQNGQAVCVKQITKCATMRCSAGYECTESGTTASCTKIVVNDDVIGNVTTNGTLTAPQGCSSVTCPIGETCEERSVQCFRAPCPNIVTCVPNDTNKNSTVRGGCDVVKCNKDETCREESVQCLMAPCPVQVSCVRLVARNSSTTTRPTSNGCPSNQTMLQCLNSCSEKKCPGMENNLLCTKHCSTGCGCSTGYLRSNDGECYKSADCPLDQLCDENEGYRCSTCEGTCKNPNPNCGGKKKCSKACVCAPGFVRKNGKCVTLKTCPSHDHGNTTCLGTQDYTDCLPKCSQLCTGAQDCDSSGNQTTCTAGCVCRGSYKLDSNGECVHNRHCFKSTDCATNEEWSKCLDDEKKCSSSSTDHKPQRDQCFSGCVCSEGFARASNGTCVDENEC